MPGKQTKLNQKQKQALNEVIDNSESTGCEVRRSQAIKLLNADTDIEAIIAITNYQRRQIFELRANYLRLGEVAIKDKRQGKPKELLTRKQFKEIAVIVKEYKPIDFGYQSEFWTTGILGNFIKRQYHITYKSKTSYYLIFKEAKFTFHKPGRVYRNHNDEEVRIWQEENEAKIFEALDNPDTEVFCEDEMILSTQTTFQKVWLPEGEYPKVEISNDRKNRSVYGFLNLKTSQEHAYKTEKQNMFITVEILKKMRIAYPKKKLFFLWDGAGWHRGSKVQEFIKTDGNIETLYFPRYAPELNPQEHVWKSGRDECSHNSFIENIDRATDGFVNFLNSNIFDYSLLDFSAVL